MSLYPKCQYPMAWHVIAETLISKLAGAPNLLYVPKRLSYSRYFYHLRLKQFQMLQQMQQQRHYCHQLHQLKRGAGGNGHATTLGIFQTQTQSMHNWKRQMDYHDRRRKIIPKLVYLHNPWKYLITKFNLWKLQLLWDREFAEEEFIRGSKQAAIVMTNIIRTQNANKISSYTTPIGFQQITRDMLLSRNDSRLKLVIFELEHLRKAIPMKVVTRSSYGRKYCFIDMLFVGLRNTKDFDSPEEVVEMNEMLRKLDEDMKTPYELLSVPHRIVFAEIFMRFRRDYTADALRKTDAAALGRHTGDGRRASPSSPLASTAAAPSSSDAAQSSSTDATTQPPTASTSAAGTALTPSAGPINFNRHKKLDDRDWSVSFYKILSFDILNYDPQK